ncbi:MAG: methyltransferase domain-containing protein, partial [Candidatus Caldarchaeum sp.]
DIFYRRLVISLVSSLTSVKRSRILKLDAYNEATNTQYGFYMMGEDADLISVDISAGIIKKAAERTKKRNLYNRSHFIVSDFRRLPIRSQAVDISCSFGSIEHVEEYAQAFYEQTRVVIVAVPNIANYSMRLLSSKILHVLGFMANFTNPEKHFHNTQLYSLAKAAGLSNIELSGYHLFPKQLRWLDLWTSNRGVDRLKPQIL